MIKEVYLCDGCKDEMNSAYGISGGDIIVRNTVGRKTYNLCKNCFAKVWTTIALLSPEPIDAKL